MVGVALTSAWLPEHWLYGGMWAVQSPGGSNHAATNVTNVSVCGGAPVIMQVLHLLRFFIPIAILHPKIALAHDTFYHINLLAIHDNSHIGPAAGGQHQRFQL